MNEVELFIKRVKGDATLRERVKKAYSVSAIVDLAQELGYGIEHLSNADINKMVSGDLDPMAARDES